MALANRSIAMVVPSIAAMARPRVFQARPARFTVNYIRLLSMRPTSRMMAKYNPEDDARAHTISQRLRQIKKIPVELLPLGLVLVVALVAAAYSLGNSLFRDKTLRLSRQNRKDD